MTAAVQEICDFACDETARKRRASLLVGADEAEGVAGERSRKTRRTTAVQASRSAVDESAPLLEAVPPFLEDAVIITDSQARVIFMNSTAETLTGWAHQEARDLPLGEIVRIFDRNTRQIVESPFSKTLRLGDAIQFACPRVLRGLDGRETLVGGGSSPIIDGIGQISGSVLTFRDVTRQKEENAALCEAQTALARVCRVNTMGELAASIAHEVNQPLAGIVTNGIACLRWLAKLADLPTALEEAREAVERIIRDGKRAGEIVARTRMLFSKSDTTREPLDLNDTINGMVALMRSHLSKHGIAPHLNLAPDLPLVLGDAVQVQQVLINLLLNAVEAMDEIEGRPRDLVIRTRSGEGRHILVEVQDSGIGIDSERAEAVFEAFHTTKVGGMGMGLSISRSIIENHGGCLFARGNEGPGATFQFTLLKCVRHGPESPDVESSTRPLDTGLQSEGASSTRSPDAIKHALRS